MVSFLVSCCASSFSWVTLVVEAADGILLILDLALEVGNHVLHVLVVVGRLLQPPLELSQAVLVLDDITLNHRHVFTQLFLAVGGLAAEVVHRHIVFHLLDARHTVRDVRHEFHEAVPLGIGRVDGILQHGIDGILALGFAIGLVAAVTGRQHGEPSDYPYNIKNLSHTYCV